MGDRFARLPKPIAAMAQYDGDANDIVRACRLAGSRIPEDVAVVGADHPPAARARDATDAGSGRREAPGLCRAVWLRKCRPVGRDPSEFNVCYGWFGEIALVNR